jgi:hypothetical protein
MPGGGGCHAPLGSLVAAHNAGYVNLNLTLTVSSANRQGERFGVVAGERLITKRHQISPSSSA